MGQGFIPVAKNISQKDVLSTLAEIVSRETKRKQPCWRSPLSGEKINKGMLLGHHLSGMFSVQCFCKDIAAVASLKLHCMYRCVCVLLLCVAVLWP